MQQCAECEMRNVTAAGARPASGFQLSRAGRSVEKGSERRLLTDGGTPGGFDGLSRRKLLLGSGAVIAAGGGGAAGFLLISGGEDGSPTPEESPKETALDFHRALHRHDLDEAETMLHPDSPVQEISPILAPMSSSNLETSVDSAKVVQQNATHARVSVQIVSVHDDEGVVNRRNVTVRLEAHEGEWLVIPQIQ